MSILTSCTFASKFDESVMFIWDHVEDERQVKRCSACGRHNHTPSRQTVVLMESEILHTVELIKPRHLRRMKRSEMKTAARKKQQHTMAFISKTVATELSSYYMPGTTGRFIWETHDPTM